MKDQWNRASSSIRLVGSLLKLVLDVKVWIHIDYQPTVNWHTLFAFFSYSKLNFRCTIAAVVFCTNACIPEIDLYANVCVCASKTMWKMVCMSRFSQFTTQEKNYAKATFVFSKLRRGNVVAHEGVVCAGTSKCAKVRIRCQDGMFFFVRTKFHPGSYVTATEHSLNKRANA